MPWPLRLTTALALLPLLLAFSGMARGTLICLHEDVLAGGWQNCEAPHAAQGHEADTCADTLSTCAMHCDTQTCVDLLLAQPGLTQNGLGYIPVPTLPAASQPMPPQATLRYPAHTHTILPLPARGPPAATACQIVTRTSVLLL